jgi:hypothetical protein
MGDYYKRKAYKIEAMAYMCNYPKKESISKEEIV